MCAWNEVATNGSQKIGLFAATWCMGSGRYLTLDVFMKRSDDKSYQLGRVNKLTYQAPCGI